MRCHKIKFFSLFYCKSDVLNSNSVVICCHSTLTMYGPLYIRVRVRMSNGVRSNWLLGYRPQRSRACRFPLHGSHTTKECHEARDRALRWCNVQHIVRLCTARVPYVVSLVCPGSSHSILCCAKRRDCKVEMRRIHCLLFWTNAPLNR